MTTRQRGGTFVGFIFGLIVGLGVALAVVVYVMKVPVPFITKGGLRGPEQDAAEAEKNRNWNPNHMLAGKPAPARPAGRGAHPAYRMDHQGSIAAADGYHHRQSAQLSGRERREYRQPLILAGHCTILFHDFRLSRQRNCRKNNVCTRASGSFAAALREVKMSYAIVFSSKTGNTALLAQTLREQLPQTDCCYFGAPDAAALAADTLYVGFWTDKGKADADTLLTEGFEGKTFPEGWKVQTTNTYDPTYTWFRFPTPEMEETGNEEDLNLWRHTGKGSAVVTWDQVGEHEDGTPADQDEWLILPASKGAQYLNFYTAIDPKVLEDQQKQLQELEIVKVDNFQYLFLQFSHFHQSH